MEGISIPLDKNLMVSAGNMRSTSNFFRPMFMKRSVSDLVTLPSRKKQTGKQDGDARPSARANMVPVVSVQYDVPRTPPSPLMYRIRRMSTPQSNYMSGRSKSEDRLISAGFIRVHNMLASDVPEYPLKLSARIDRRLEAEKERKQSEKDARSLPYDISDECLLLAVVAFYWDAWYPVRVNINGLDLSAGCRELMTGQFVKLLMFLWAIINDLLSS